MNDTNTSAPQPAEEPLPSLQLTSREPQSGPYPGNLRSNIRFNVDGRSVIVLSQDGMQYNGEMVKDAGEAYRAFLSTMELINRANASIQRPHHGGDAWRGRLGLDPAAPSEGKPKPREWWLNVDCDGYGYAYTSESASEESKALYMSERECVHVAEVL